MARIRASGIAPNLRVARTRLAGTNPDHTPEATFRGAAS